MDNIEQNASPSDVQEGVRITRMFNAPPELVWRAWTEPEMVMQWWGPAEFTSPHCELDLRVGGKFHYCMRDADGNDIWATGVYKEIVPHKRLVMTDCFADEKGNVVPASYYGMEGDFELEFLITVTLEEVEGKTRMTLLHTGLPAGGHTEDATQGWNSSLDKLQALVEK